MEDISYFISFFVYGFICGFIGHRMALRNKRSGDLWFFLCFLFGIIGVLILAILGDSDVKRKEQIEEEHRIRLEYEERRLREKLEMEARIRKELEEQYRKG